MTNSITTASIPYFTSSTSPAGITYYNSSGNRMLVNSNGNVSIGITNPSQKLHIHSERDPELFEIGSQFHDLLFKASKRFSQLEDGWIYKTIRVFDSIHGQSSKDEMIKSIQEIYSRLDEINCSHKERTSLGELIDRSICISWLCMFDYEEVVFSCTSNDNE